MSTTQTLYATDEDIALRASADFSSLCPRDQKLAYGNDGVFLPGSPWTLNSPTVDFQANGLVAGQLVQLTRPSSSFRPPGETLVVVSVAPGAVTLRRKGQAAGVGQPPGGHGAVTSVEFLVATLLPQIALASYDLNRRYGINDLIAGRRPADLYDSQEVRAATVLTVLYNQYLDMSRGSSDQPDVFAAKAQNFKQELDDLLDRAVVHWVPATSGGSTPPSTRLSTRLTR